MAVYWMSFRLKDDPTYEQRYQGLYDAVQSVSSKWWIEATSFIVFESDLIIDGLVKAIKSVVDKDDLVIIGMPEFKSARLIGNTEDKDIFLLMPFIKRA